MSLNRIGDWRGGWPGSILVVVSLFHVIPVGFSLSSDLYSFLFDTQGLVMYQCLFLVFAYALCSNYQLASSSLADNSH